MQGMNKSTGLAASGIEHLKQSIADILTTPIGSRVMRRDYGSQLFDKIDNPITGELIAEIYIDVVEALFNYEPRFDLTNVTVADIQKGKIVLDLEGKYKPTGETVTLNGLTIS